MFAELEAADIGSDLLFSYNIKRLRPLGTQPFNVILFQNCW